MGRVTLPAVLLSFALLATAFNLTIPLFEAPDEQVHFLYVRHLATGRGLPRQLPGELESYAGQQSSQPPLYYALVAALTFWVETGDMREDIRDVFASPGMPLARAPAGPPARGPGAMFGHDRAMEAFPFHGATLAVHLGRALSTLFGLVAIAATYRLARALVPWRPAVAVAAAALLGLNPQFVFLSAVLNNDALVNAASAVALALAVPLILTPADAVVRWRWWALGLTAAVASAAKYSGLPLYALAAGVLAATTHGPGWCARTRLTLPALLVPAVLLLGAWVARNQLLYGDPLGWAFYLSATGRMIRPMPLDPARWATALDSLWTSYWLTFGWMNLGGPAWLYRGAAALCLAAALGWLALLVGRRLSGAQRAGFALLALWSTLVLALVLAWIGLNPSAAQGRLLFPAAPALATLLAAGLIGPMPARLARPATILLTLALIALDLWAWRAILTPAYAA